MRHTPTPAHLFVSLRAELTTYSPLLRSFSLVRRDRDHPFLHFKQNTVFFYRSLLYSDITFLSVFCRLFVIVNSLYLSFAISHKQLLGGVSRHVVCSRRTLFFFFVVQYFL